MIHDIEEYRPHLRIPGKVMVHIKSLRTMQDIVNRKIKISDVKGFDDFGPAIVEAWLALQKG